jgi:hypothetical protein
LRAAANSDAKRRVFVLFAETTVNDVKNFPYAENAKGLGCVTVILPSDAEQRGHSIFSRG